MSLSATCQRKGCGGASKLLPMLHLYADRRRYPNAPPATMIVGLAVCEACSQLMTVADVVSDEGWAQIVESFRAINKAEPRREDIQLTFLGIDGPIAKAWQASVDATARRVELMRRHEVN